MLTRLLRSLGWGQADTAAPAPAPAPAPATENVNDRRVTRQRLGLDDETIDLEAEVNLLERASQRLGQTLDRLEALLEPTIAVARATWTPEQQRRFDAAQAAWDAPLDGDEDGELGGREGTRPEPTQGRERTAARTATSSATALTPASTAPTGREVEDTRASPATASG